MTSSASERRSKFSGRADRLLAKTAAAVAAAAAAGLVAQPQTAEAGIVYSGVVNINIPTSISGVYLNLVTGANGGTPASAPGWDINPWGTSTLFSWANNAASPNDGIVDSLGSSTTLSDNLAVGTLVNNSLGYGRTDSPETTGATAFLVNSTNNYVGIRFLNESTNQINFGWVRYSTGATLAGQPRSIIGYAYENMGAGINVGDTGSTAVPEPGTLSLLAAGAAGLAAFRLRRRVA